LPIDLVHDFPIDYMHATCLGVVRQILMLLIEGDNSHRLHGKDIAQISKQMTSLSVYMPAEFTHKPRALKSIKRFKAIEFQQILFYTSVLAFSKYTQVEKCFRVLQVAHLILLHPTWAHNVALVNYAGDLLSHFVNLSSQVFGEHFVVEMSIQ
jgi:hypothetical protein